MFSITPYTATRHTVRIRDGKTFQIWEPCRVVGIDATGDEPRYLVEICKDGECFLDRADLIRKAPPTAN